MKDNRHYAALLIISFLALSTVLFYGFSQVITYFRTGADPSGMLLLSADEVDYFYRPDYTWSGIEEAEGRPMEEGTLQKVSKDYLAGYYYQYQASGHGHEMGLKDYYSDKARQQLKASAMSYKNGESSHRGTTIQHNLRLKFYSDDGTIITLSDEVVSFNKVYSGGRYYRHYDTATYEVMLLLEDNFWRVRHKIRGLPEKRFNPENLEKSAVSIQNNHFIVNGRPLHLKSLNYYPKQYPWRMMWENFDSIDFASDFKKVREAGFNSLRIFIPYEAFGKAEIRPEEIDKLKRLMDLAQVYELKVIVTLFDFFLGYRIEEWTLSDRHAQAVVTALRDHPALLAWDVKNEPDLDFESFGKGEVLDWLDFITQRIRTYDPNHLITIGWSQPEASMLLTEQVDFLSFHFYRDPKELDAFMNNLPELNIPILLEETGMHSYDAWWYPFGKSEAEQADYLEQVLAISKKYNLHYAIWTLYDFENVPGDVAGDAPWRRRPQMRYGLIDTKMNKKKVYEVVKKYNEDEN
ncbi:cellulase family glycosylhydrolase [Roseivirga sp. BDSF3-8]|uniref:cellulase family glycosylhydrolase n=1 Tax=Roseivirga sp. BDSF3-8 TaxID=3241598 RepID=UPI003531B389